MREAATLRTVMVLVALTASALATRSPAAAAEEPVVAVPYIVGGTEVTPTDDTPWLTAVLIGDEPDPYFAQYCVGTLISSTHVLTAGHCVKDQFGQPVLDVFEVAVGILDLSDITSADRHEVVATPHPSWTGTGGVDLAILTLSDPIQGIEPLFIRPVAPAIGDPVTAYGWGGTLQAEQGNNSYPYAAHKGTMTVKTDYGSTTNCGFDSADPVEHSHQFCFGDPDQAVCFGDSGGPVVMFDGGIPSLVGTTSQGPTTCNATGADEIAERVIDSLAWIESFTGTAGCRWNPDSYEVAYVGWTVPCWLAPASGSSLPFVDVNFSFFYIEGVKWLWSNAITTGTSPTTFSPDDPVTRGQLAAFLWRFAGRPPGVGVPFADITAPWQVQPVAWLDTWGFTTGTSPTTFSPDDPVTRAQLVTFMWRLLGEPSPAGPSGFADVGSSEYFSAAVAWAAENGITTGYPDGTFKPHRPVTRGELATFLWRLARLVEASASA